MKTALFFQLLINLFLSLIILLFGILLISWPFMRAHYAQVFEMLTLYPWITPIAGLILAIIGLSLLSWTSSLLKKGHYVYAPGITKVLVDEKIFEKTLNNCWKVKFPGKNLSCHALIRRNKLHIIAEIPHLEGRRAKKDFIKELSHDLSHDLYKTLGYSGDFTLCLSSV